MTTVEWLYNEIKHIIPNDYVRKFEQAKEMFEKQIGDAYQKGYRNGGDNFGYGNKTTPKEYYNETFKNIEQ